MGRVARGVGSEIRLRLDRTLRATCDHAAPSVVCGNTILQFSVYNSNVGSQQRVLPHSCHESFVNRLTAITSQSPESSVGISFGFEAKGPGIESMCGREYFISMRPQNLSLTIYIFRLLKYIFLTISTDGSFLGE
jgi:hypothetical protein